MHHNFIKRIAIHWITSWNDNISGAWRSGANRPLLSISKGGRKRRRIITTGSTSTIVSSLSMECGVVNPKKCRASNINNTALHNTSHLSKIRLDSSLPHYPQIGKINTRCALHRWLGHETENYVYFFSTCNVNLCVGCNKLFILLLTYYPSEIHLITNLNLKYSNTCVW